jgi:hypothetical protein
VIGPGLDLTMATTMAISVSRALNAINKGQFIAGAFLSVSPKMKDESCVTGRAHAIRQYEIVAQ